MADPETDPLETLSREVERRQRELSVLANVAARVHAEDEEAAVFEIGLGLAIVQQITRHHDGTVRTGRGPLGGAAFTIDLPAAAPGEGERL